MKNITRIFLALVVVLAVGYVVNAQAMGRKAKTEEVAQEQVMAPEKEAAATATTEDMGEPAEPQQMAQADEFKPLAGRGPGGNDIAPPVADESVVNDAVQQELIEEGEATPDPATNITLPDCADDGGSITSTATTPGNGGAMLILDASGSMWGQVNGKTKIELARAAVKEMMSEWPEDQKLGLMAYGHRRKGDCTDIELLYNVQKAEPGRIVDTVDKLNALGKTPIADSLVKASEVLKNNQEKATIILITDGIETCRETELCDQVEELEKQGVDFTAHVVGFDLEDKDLDTLQCIADKSGGEFFAANNAEELTASLGEITQDLQAGCKGVELVPFDKLDGKPVRFVMEKWEVYPAGVALSPENAVFTAKYAHSPVVSLPAGDYVVLTERGTIRAVKQITITDETREVQVPLEVGYIKVKVRVAEGSKSSGAMGGREIYQIVDIPGIEPYKIASQYTATDQEVPVAAGQYLVKAGVHSVTGETTVDVKAGEHVDAEINLLSGKVRFETTSASNPGKRVYITWGLYTPENADQWETLPPLAKIPDQRSILVKAGTYVAVTKYGGKLYKVNVTVKPDETVEIKSQID